MGLRGTIDAGSGGAPGQASVALPLSQVITLHKTSINGLTDGRGLQAGGHGLGIPEHDVGLHLHDVTTPADFDNLGIVQLGSGPWEPRRSCGYHSP